jgi:hypothetical protein
MTSGVPDQINAAGAAPQIKLRNRIRSKPVPTVM